MGHSEGHRSSFQTQFLVGFAQHLQLSPSTSQALPRVLQDFSSSNSPSSPFLMSNRGLEKLVGCQNYNVAELGFGLGHSDSMALTFFFWSQFTSKGSASCYLVNKMNPEIRQDQGTALHNGLLINGKKITIDDLGSSPHSSQALSPRVNKVKCLDGPTE